jgi:hypothetical protein
VDQHRVDERMPQQFHKGCRVGVLLHKRRLLLRSQSTIRRLFAETVTRAAKTPGVDACIVGGLINLVDAFARELLLEFQKTSPAPPLAEPSRSHVVH